MNKSKVKKEFSLHYSNTPHAPDRNDLHHHLWSSADSCIYVIATVRAAWGGGGGGEQKYGYIVLNILNLHSE